MQIRCASSGRAVGSHMVPEVSQLWPLTALNGVIIPITKVIFNFLNASTFITFITVSWAITAVGGLEHF